MKPANEKQNEGTVLGDLNEDMKNTVIARLQTIPQDVKISIGNEGTFSVDELIERVEAEDKIGQETIKIQFDYLRSLKDLPIDT